MADDNYDIIFRVDGGNIYSVAMGHAFRCRRLASALRQRGVGCHFIMKNLPPGIRLIRDAGFSITPLKDGMTTEQTASAVVQSAMDHKAALFIDLREDAGALIDAAGSRGVFTIVYEDVFSTSRAPNVLINPSPLTMDYPFANTKLYLGIDYLMLSQRLKDFTGKPFSPRIENLLVSFGGADPCNLSERVAKLLLSTTDQFTLHLVLGPAYEPVREISRKIERWDQTGRLVLHRNIDNFYELAHQCDAAIIAGGTTMFEMIALSIPSLVLPSIGHEAEAAGYLKNKGLVEGMTEDVNLVSDAAMHRTIDLFLSSSQLRRDLHRNALSSSLLDGTIRVADIVGAIASK